MQGVDGVLSTRIIRMLEKEMKHRRQLQDSNSKRVPIIAVSSFLDEDNRFDYIQTGYVFDPFFKTQIDMRK